jgi:hypothetical protein
MRFGTDTLRGLTEASCSSILRRKGGGKAVRVRLIGEVRYIVKSSSRDQWLRTPCVVALLPGATNVAFSKSSTTDQR